MSILAPSPFAPGPKDRTEKNSVSKDEKDRLARIDFVMHQNDITSYILLMQAKGQKNGMTFHIQNVNTRSALQALLVSLSQVIKLELNSHPEYDKAYKKIFEDLLLDIYGVVEKANNKILDFRKKAEEKK